MSRAGQRKNPSAGSLLASRWVLAMAYGAKAPHPKERQRRFFGCARRAREKRPAGSLLASRWVLAMAYGAKAPHPKERQRRFFGCARRAREKRPAGSLLASRWVLAMAYGAKAPIRRSAEGGSSDAPGGLERRNRPGACSQKLFFLLFSMGRKPPSPSTPQSAPAPIESIQ